MQNKHGMHELCMAYICLLPITYWTIVPGLHGPVYNSLPLCCQSRGCCPLATSANKPGAAGLFNLDPERCLDVTHAGNPQGIIGLAAWKHDTHSGSVLAFAMAQFHRPLLRLLLDGCQAVRSHGCSMHRLDGLVLVDVLCPSIVWKVAFKVLCNLGKKGPCLTLDEQEVLLKHLL